SPRSPMVTEVEYDANRFLKQKSDSLKKLVWGPMEPRQPILEPWLERGSAALVWGPTGVGKSYFAQTIALTVATGGSLPNIGWRAPGDSFRKVLWFDGEQGLRTAQARSRQLLTGGAMGKSPVATSPSVMEAAQRGELDRYLDYRNKVVRPQYCPDI